MAVRRHVTASLAAADQVRRVFCELLGDSFNDIPIESTGDWNFFVTSVWGVDSRKLREGLRQLGGTGLQATTEDGSRWYMTLFQRGAEPVQFMHEFDLFMTERNPDETADEPEDDEEIDPRLAFLEPDPQPGAKRRWSQFDYVAEDYAEMGRPIADSFRDSVDQLNIGAAVNRFRQYESHRMLDALLASGLEFDRQTFLDALLWNSTTEVERDSDLGNLPRVLAALGLAGSLADYVLECEQSQQTQPSDGIDEESLDDADNEDDDFDDEDFDDDDDEEMTAAEMANFELEVQKMIKDQQRTVSRPKKSKQGKSQNQQTRLIDTTLNAANQVQPVPVVGGAVPLLPVEIPVLHLFANAVCLKDTPAAVIRIDLPDSFDGLDVVVGHGEPGFMESRPLAAGWLLGIQSLDLMDLPKEDGWQPDRVRHHFGDQMAEILRAPVDGTRIEICVADPATPATWMWFVGDVADGTWQIEATYPAMDGNSLADALNLTRNAEQSEHDLRDEEEVEQIMAAVIKDDFLHSMDVRSSGLRVSCEYDTTGFLARLIFRHRFAHVFDVQPVLAHVEQQYQERRILELQAKRSAVQFRKNTSAPCDKSKVIYRGSESVYWAADFASWEKLEAKPLKEFQAAMADLQFQCVGDFVCKKFREFVLSFFLGPDGKSFGSIMANSFGYAGYEFVSHFENDAHLTTSTSWMAQSHPEVENYAQNCPDKSPADLYQQHLWGIERFRTHKQTLPIDLPSTLAGIAEMFDRLLAKMKSVESDLFVEDDDDEQDE